MQDAFITAIYAQPRRVMGYTLQPLSAAHLLCMHALNLPAVTMPNCSIADIVVGAKIAAAPIKVIMGSYRPDINPARLKPTLRDHWWMARCSVNRDTARQQVEEWSEYLEEYLTMPLKYETPLKQAAALTSPGVMATVIRALDRVTEERAWTMPYGTLRVMDEIHAELNGEAIRFQPTEEELAESEVELSNADDAGAELLKSWGMRSETEAQKPEDN
jgi:hypothetical protein